jgi:hypothetical protein
MSITFNKKSWHYKYFNWITGMEPPKSLCPYFWINVGITLLLPIILMVKLITYIVLKISYRIKTDKPVPYFVNEFGKEYLKTEFEIKYQKKKTKFFNKLGNFIASIVSNFVIFVVIPLLILFLVFCFGLTLFTTPFDLLLTVILQVVSMYLGVIIMYNFLKEISGIFKYLNPFNWKITKILWEIIKSIYNKACPLIEWKN